MSKGTKKPGDDQASRVYVACLASYNAGVLFGRWIDVEGHDEETLGAEIAEMLRGSPHPNTTVECPDCEGEGHTPAGTCVRSRPGSLPSLMIDLVHRCPRCKGEGELSSAEEYAIHDYDGPLGPMASWFGEHPDLETLCEVVEAFEDHDPGAVMAFVAWEGQWDLGRFEESYQGEWDSFGDFAENLADETIEGLRDPQSLPARYFDYEAFAQDLHHDYHEEDGHVFICI